MGGKKLIWYIIAVILLFETKLLAFIGGLPPVEKLSDEGYWTLLLLLTLLLIVLAFLTIRKVGERAPLSLKSFKWWYFLLIPPLLYAKYLWRVLVFTQFPLPQNQEIINDVVPALSSYSLTVFNLIFFVAGPILEELIYRGIVMSILLKKLKNYYLDVVLSAVFFAFIHIALDQFVWTNVIYYGGASLLYALLYRKTGSIYLPILLHVLWNSHGFILHLLGIR